MEIIFGVLVAFFQSFLIEYFRGGGDSEPDYLTGYKTASITFAIAFAIAPLVSGILLREKKRTRKEIKADTRVGFLANVKGSPSR